MRLYPATAALAGVLTLVACNDTSPSETPSNVEIEFDFDSTKTKTVTAPPATVQPTYRAPATSTKRTTQTPRPRTTR